VSAVLTVKPIGSPGAPGQRQRKEPLVHSMTSKTPARTTPRAEDIRIKQSALFRAPVTHPRLFLSSTVHGAFSLFLR